jgi:hypothetical protein
VVVIRILAEMWMVKTILMRHQTEMRNKVLETGVKASLSIKCEELD